MSWDDWTNEDPWESLDRSREDPYESRHPFGAEYAATFSAPKAIERTCTRCDFGFKSSYPSACPECGGWTETKVRFDKV